MNNEKIYKVLLTCKETAESSIKWYYDEKDVKGQMVPASIDNDGLISTLNQMHGRYYILRDNDCFERYCVELIIQFTNLVLDIVYGGINTREEANMKFKKLWNKELEAYIKDTYL